MTVLLITAAAVGGLLAGAELVIATGVRVVLNSLGTATGPARAAAAAVFGRWMPLAYAGLGVLLVAWLIMAPSGPGAAALGTYLLIMALTLIFMVPLNNRIARQAATDPGPAWQPLTRRWDRLNAVRVGLLLVIDLLLLLVLAA